MLKQPKDLTEGHLIGIWLQELAGCKDLVTEEGSTVRIMYPGRVNSDRGADLLNAVIATDEGIMFGDVEVHVKSSNWWLHKHHRDPMFNQVVLHVVFRSDARFATNLQNGKIIHTLALSKYVGNVKGVGENETHIEKSPGMPCNHAVAEQSINARGELLDAAGEQRFSGKADRFMADLAGIEAGQVLYQGMMGALGYTKNRIVFEELAHRLPLRILESLAGSEVSDEECLIRLQAMLLGTAGLLPSQSAAWHCEIQDDDRVAKLEKAWGSSFHGETISESDWHFFKVRPGNFPTRRIAAMSYCILKNREKGILAGLLGRVREARGCHELERMLLVPADDYWARHYDFGPASRIKGGALLGGGRASVIVVNIFLPFTFAWGRLNSQSELAEKALDIYRHYPRLAENIVERHMQRQLRMKGGQIDSARRQQGLLQVYGTLCTQGKCCLCPLGR